MRLDADLQTRSDVVLELREGEVRTKQKTLNKTKNSAVLTAEFTSLKG